MVRRVLRRTRDRSRDYSDERGAVSIFVGLLVLVLLVSAAFVVDIGMQRVARADMQALADVVALDLARELDGSTAGALRSSMNAEAAQSLARNADTIGELPDLTVTLGRLDNDGEFQAVADSDVPTAVQVVAGTEVGFAFADVTGVDSGATNRRAIAVAQSAACFQLGSYAATIQPSAAPYFKDLMGPLIGTSTVGLVGYNGLATASITLRELIDAPTISVGTVDALLEMPSLTVANFFTAMAYVLRDRGDVAQAQVLESAAHAVAPATIKLGDLLGIGSAGDAALDIEFNALDLLVGGALLANGTNLLGVHNLQASVPSVGVTNTRFTIIEKPRRACNDEEAQTAQVRLTSDLKLSLKIPLLKTTVLDLRLVDATGQPNGEAMLKLDVEIAGAHGHLTEVGCDPASFTAEIWRDLVRLSLTGQVLLKGSVKVKATRGDLGLPLGPGQLLTDLVEIDVPVTFGLAVETGTYKPPQSAPTVVGPVTYPPHTYEAPVSAAPDPIVLPYIGTKRVEGTLQVEPVKVGTTTVTASVLEPLVKPVIDGGMGLLASEFSVLNQVVDKVNEMVASLSAGMGLTLAGADFFALPTPVCGRPVLRR